MIIEIVNQETVIDVNGETFTAEVLVTDASEENAKRFALEALDSANEAEANATIATNQAIIATNQAGNALTSANNAEASEDAAALSALEAASAALNTPLTGFATGANTTILSTDTTLQAFGKTQGQINARVSGIGANGQVAFWSGTGTQTGDSKLTWNNTEGVLIINSQESVSPTRGLIVNQANDGVQAAAITFKKSRGTIASPTNVNVNDLVAAFTFSARVGGAFTSDRALFGANMTSSTGIGLFFCAGSSDGSYAPAIYVHPTKNVVIGSTGSILTGVTDAGFRLDVNGTARVQGAVTLTSNIILPTVTGTRIGTATNQLLSLWNATPNVQPTTAITAGAFVANTSGIVNDTATFDGYTLGQIVAALRRIGALA